MGKNNTNVYICIGATALFVIIIISFLIIIKNKENTIHKLKTTKLTNSSEENNVKDEDLDNHEKISQELNRKLEGERETEENSEAQDQANETLKDKVTYMNAGKEDIQDERDFLISVAPQNINIEDYNDDKFFLESIIINSIKQKTRDLEKNKNFEATIGTADVENQEIKLNSIQPDDECDINEEVPSITSQTEQVLFSNKKPKVLESHRNANVLLRAPRKKLQNEFRFPIGVEENEKITDNCDLNEQDNFISIENYEALIDNLQTPQEKIEIYNKLAKLLIESKRYLEAIEYLNLSLKINLKDNLPALYLRTDCYEALGNREQIHKGKLLLERLDNLTLNPISKKISLIYILSQKTKYFVKTNTLKVSNILFPYYFAVFKGILPKHNNELSKMIIDNEWQSLNDALMDPNWKRKYSKFNNGLFTIKSLRGGLLFFKGLKDEAIDCLKSPSTQFEKLLKEFVTFNPLKDEFKITNIDVNGIVESMNPTLIYFLAKFYYFGKRFGEYIRLLDLIKDQQFVYHDLLHHFKVKNMTEEFKKCEKEAIEKFGYTPFLLPLFAQHAYEVGDYQYFEELLKLMGENDPHYPMMHYLLLYKGDNVEECLEYLDKTLQRFPLFFPAYINKGDILSSINPKESLEIFQKALHCASSYNEVYLVYSKIVNLEIQIELENL